MANGKQVKQYPVSGMKACQFTFYHQFIVTSILNYNNIKIFKLSGYDMLYLGQCEESSIVIMQNSEILIKEILLKGYLGDSCM